MLTTYKFFKLLSFVNSGEISLNRLFFNILKKVEWNGYLSKEYHKILTVCLNVEMS